MTGRSKGFLPFTLRTVLRSASWWYGGAVSLRNWAFDQGLFKCYVAPVPVVISVGNIVLGGTGKTPITHALAKRFSSEFSVSILTRGYRSAAEKLKMPVVLSEGNGPLYDAAHCGDEACLLAKKLPGVKVVVGRDRKKSSVLSARRGAQVILLDDGMQYRYLARDFEVVVVDANDPLGQGYLFPRGFLREKASGLRRADVIVLNHGAEKEQVRMAKHQISRHTDAPIVVTKPVIDALRTRQGDVIPSVEGKKVGLFCGIAKPENFVRLVEEAGAEIVAEFFVQDHRVPSQKELTAFADKCQLGGAELLLCTEKDEVKLNEKHEGSLPVAVLEMSLDIVEGEEHWNTLIENIRAQVLRDSALIRNSK